MKSKVLYGVLVMTTLLLISCSKDPVKQLENDEKSVYITNRVPGVDYSQYQTFALADSVVVLDNNQLVEKVRTEYDANFINAVAAQIEARGYTRVALNADPDLGLTVSRIYNDYSGVVSYGDYWDYYGGYWDPYYWGYPGYGYGFPVYYSVYTITEGAVTVDMIDLKNADVNSQLRLVWNGLVRGTGTFSTARAAAHAAALFAQSKYISR